MYKNYRYVIKNWKNIVYYKAKNILCSTLIIHNNITLQYGRGRSHGDYLDD